MPAPAVQGDTRRRILDAARDELLEYGTRDSRSARIAAEAGASESTVFRHYKDIVGVLQAVYDDAWGAINEHLQRKAYTDPLYADADAAILADFRRLLELRDDPELADRVDIAILYFRRPLELGAEYVSPQQTAFTQRLTTLCAAAMAARGSSMPAALMADVLTNFLATAWLTWMNTEGDGQISVDMWCVGVASILNGYGADVLDGADR